MLRSLIYFVVSRWRCGLRTADNDDLSRDVELLILRHRLCLLARGRRPSLRRTDRLLLAAAIYSRPKTRGAGTNGEVSTKRAYHAKCHAHAIPGASQAPSGLRVRRRRPHGRGRGGHAPSSP
jgi:hypothetical protein